jgi:uncharacterized membrane protein YeaQ/YmgE (transglycosylase-associated protein family)
VVEAWLLYTIAGLLGGLTSGLIWARGWDDLKAFDFFRDVVLGAIGGFVFYLAHTEWHLPNGVVAFVWGYAFKDIVEALVEKVKMLWSMNRRSRRAEA